MDEKKKTRTKVRVERVDTKCGYAGHMTADEIKARAASDEVELSCPECGEIHLTPEDAMEAAERRYTRTKRYQQIKDEAGEG